MAADELFDSDAEEEVAQEVLPLESPTKKKKTRHPHLVSVSIALGGLSSLLFALGGLASFLSFVAFAR